MENLFLSKYKNSLLFNKLLPLRVKENSLNPIISDKRFEIGFYLLNQWLQFRNYGKSIILYFEDNLIQNIAIYGMGALGERLYEELHSSKVFVAYAIDRMAASKNIPELKIYTPDIERLPETEAIVVTPVQDYWQIVELLESKTNAPILSLRDVIDYCAIGE